MDQLAGPVPPLAMHRFDIGGTVTVIKPTQALAAKDLLNCQRRLADVMREVVRGRMWRA